jgi:hypothetical protein
MLHGAHCPRTTAAADGGTSRALSQGDYRVIGIVARPCLIGHLERRASLAAWVGAVVRNLGAV